MRDVHEKATSQYSPVAANYAKSTGHGNLDELARLVALLNLSGKEEVLDVATGTGHTAMALAPQARRVVAYDLTPAMLGQAAASAADRGIRNLECVQGAAENLPFGDESFDVVANRFAAHHFADLWAALTETARVLKPGGQFLLVDVVAPERDDVDIDMNEIEVLRDPSHVRNYKASEWRTMVEGIGLEVELLELGWYADAAVIEFDEWTRRIGTPNENIEPLRERFEKASPGLKEALKIEVGDKITFLLPQMTLRARKPA